MRRPSERTARSCKAEVNADHGVRLWNDLRIGKGDVALNNAPPGVAVEIVNPGKRIKPINL